MNNDYGKTGCATRLLESLGVLTAMAVTGVLLRALGNTALGAFGWKLLFGRGAVILLCWFGLALLAVVMSRNWLWTSRHSRLRRSSAYGAIRLQAVLSCLLLTATLVSGVSGFASASDVSAAWREMWGIYKVEMLLCVMYFPASLAVSRLRTGTWPQMTMVSVTFAVTLVAQPIVLYVGLQRVLAG